MRDIWVEFNSIDEDRTATTLLRFAHDPSAVVEGASLLAGDDEGNVCRARVVEVRDNRFVKLALDLDTFEQCAAVLLI